MSAVNPRPNPQGWRDGRVAAAVKGEGLNLSPVRVRGRRWPTSQTFVICSGVLYVSYREACAPSDATPSALYFHTPPLRYDL